MNHPRTWQVLCWLSLALAGCQQKTAPGVEPGPRATTAFDLATVGTIHGQVTWQGQVPQVPPFQVHSHVLSPNATPKTMQRPNPNAPAINPGQGGVAKAVVFLRGVNPSRARFWSHPPVRIEQGDYQLDVVQGAHRGLIGFMRWGNTLEMVATRPTFHSLRAQGAAFFSLPFVEPGQIASRMLDKKGLVELSSGAGYYWMRGYLFVDDHPYYARTDAEGRYLLEDVPPGAYSITCWLPNWHIKRQERDPESSLVTRIFFAPPVELEQTVDVKAGERCRMDFAVSSRDFEVGVK